ncbi:MAG: Eco57I restriction-modification methylase domain-containing protein [Mycoplasma sp.]
MNKTFLGQVFTPSQIVEKMINLISNQKPKLILEPSSGSGNFYLPLKQKFENVIGIEIDKTIAHQDAIISSYFETNFKPDVIIGNPPYVDFKNIDPKLKSDLLNHKPNLFLFFLEKALSDLEDYGELIWIIPSTIFTSSSSKKLNQFIYDNFSITYWEQIPENIWENASVPTSIVKIVKTKNHIEKINYFISGGKIFFGEKPVGNFKSIIKVGGACGFNSQLENGDTPFVVSYTERTKELKNIKYEPTKWIRPVPKPPVDYPIQIFVNCKTRNKKPFYFLNNKEFLNYDAAVLCIFLKCNKNEVDNIVNWLNNIDWEKLGVLKDGRYHFSQSILNSILN